jgi:hypothetical protein
MGGVGKDIGIPILHSVFILSLAVEVGSSCSMSTSHDCSPGDSQPPKPVHTTEIKPTKQSQSGACFTHYSHTNKATNTCV